MVMGTVYNYSHDPIEENKTLPKLLTTETQIISNLCYVNLFHNKNSRLFTTPHATDMLIWHINKFKKLVCESADLSAVRETLL